VASTQDVVNDYMAAWNETDEGKRRALLERCWAADGLYCDPLSDGRGREALNGFIASMQSQQPGARIEIASGIDAHHNQIRFAWSFIQADGMTAIEGIDVGELASDGRLARIVGYWGAPPAMT
jgi:hypothetical protein